MPFSTWAEKPPMKSMPTLVRGAIERAGDPRRSRPRPPRPATSEIGVTAMRLLTIGMPNSLPISRLVARQVGGDLRVILS